MDGILREKARLVRSNCRLGGPPESSNPSANWLSQFRTIVKREYPFTKYWNEKHWGNNLHRPQLLSCEIGNKNDITTITETNRKENHQEGEQQNFWILWVWPIRSNSNLSTTKEWNANSVWNCDFFYLEGAFIHFSKRRSIGKGDMWSPSHMKLEQIFPMVVKTPPSSI